MAAGVCSSLLCTKSSITCFFQTSSSSYSNSTQINFRPTTRFTNIVSCVKSGRSSLGHEAVGEGHWVVVVKPPSPHQGGSRSHVVDYYVEILERVLGSEKDAQGCIYNACCDTKFWFCCDVDQQTAQQLAGLAEVLSVDEDLSSFPGWKHWAVDVLQVPEIRSRSRPQLVDYYTQMLTKVLENEKDAQMCIYGVSLQHPNYGFCCQLDEESARKLAGVPGVLSVKPDYNGAQDGISGGSQPTNIIKTKKLFVTGLSFYTSEKTLREAFEGFGELVEVKIIMDKISKRSKGYAFIEYTTEEAAAAALTEMNGKIINGWMIVVDVAKTSPPKYTRRPPR